MDTGKASTDENKHLGHIAGFQSIRGKEILELGRGWETGEKHRVRSQPHIYKTPGSWDPGLKEPIFLFVDPCDQRYKGEKDIFTPLFKCLWNYLYQVSTPAWRSEALSGVHSPRGRVQGFTFPWVD